MQVKVLRLQWDLPLKHFNKCKKVKRSQQSLLKIFHDRGQSFRGIKTVIKEIENSVSTDK